MQNIKPKRLILDNTPDMHAEIKAKAALRGMSMKDYVLRAILRQMQEDKKYG
jgi:hypothetical protein